MMEDDRTTSTGKSTLIGTRIGNYELVDLLGKGGMGEVYLGRHPLLGKEVAVKVLAGTLGSIEAQVNRFRQEARAACRIGHPSIVNVIDFGELEDGRSYCVMERLDGQTLGQLLAEHGALSLQAALAIVAPIADALQAAHAAGIVHRDIKPDNVFLARGHKEAMLPKLLDFGIAKLTESSSDVPLAQTQTGSLMGTPLYMSPEQAAGAVHSIGPASDIYSMGAMLFHVLTGQPPFSGESFGDILLKIMQTPAPSIRTIRPELPAPLDGVIARALAKRPDERYASMTELMRALVEAASVDPELVLERGLLPDAHLLPSSSKPLEATGPLMSRGAPVRTSSAADASPAGVPSPEDKAQEAEKAATARADGRRRRRSFLLLWVAGSCILLGAAAAFALLLSRSERSRTASSNKGSKGMVSGKEGPVASGRKTGPAPGRKTGFDESTDDDRSSKKIWARHGVTIIETASKAIKYPVDYDTKRFPALDYYKKALQHARKRMSDAVLVDFEVNGVHPDGHVDLTLHKSFQAEYVFRSPSRSRLRPNLPKNIDHELRCLVHVDVSARGVEVYTSESQENCREKPRSMWRCSLEYVWDSAKKKGAPTKDVVAKINWLWDGWFFSAGEAAMSIPDACK